MRALRLRRPRQLFGLSLSLSSLGEGGRDDPKAFRSLIADQSRGRSGTPAVVAFYDRKQDTRAGAVRDPGLGVVHEHEWLRRRRLPGASPLGLSCLVLYLFLRGSWGVLLG